MRATTECVNQLELSEEEKRDIQQVVDWTTSMLSLLIRFLIFQIPLMSLSIQSETMPG